MSDDQIVYASVPGAGGDDAFFCLKKKALSDFQSYLKATLCAS